MATYRLAVQVISRSKGRRATAAAAYRAGDRIEDERTGEIFDYRHRKDVLYRAIYVPGDSPAWMTDRARLWNAAELAERRRDAQVAREIQVSLPHELSLEANQELLGAFVSQECCARGMVADLAIHQAHRGGDERNIHAHVLLSMRVATRSGFGKKDRSWNQRALLTRWRSEWSLAVNRQLELAGVGDRVTHMSYVDRGIDREAEPKQGPIATAMERRGKTSLAGSDRRACRARNARRAALRKTVREPECNLQRLSAGPGSAENIADAATVFSITSAEVGHWQRWREQVLSKRYAADLRGSALARFWRIEFSHDALIFSNSRGRFIDEGWRISTKQGNAIELRGMLDAAAAHGWQELVVSGDYHFKRRAMAMALNRGFAVVAEGADLELLREMQARGNHGKAAARHRPQEEKFETDFFSAHQRQGERSRGIGR